MSNLWRLDLDAVDYAIIAEARSHSKIRYGLIATRVRRHRRTVIRHMRMLEERRLIEVVRRRGGIKRNLPNRFILDNLWRRIALATERGVTPSNPRGRAIPEVTRMSPQNELPR